MLSDARVEVVLINYKRPQNISQIVNAFRNQTVGCHIALIDAASSPEFGLTEEVRQSVDHLFTWTPDCGPYTRYVPIAVYSHEFTYFHDDDMLPGSRVIEHFIKAADSIKEFGVLGQMGRYVDATGAYIARDIRRKERLVPVDVVVRGFFVRTKHLPAVLQQRLNLGLVPDPSLEDDLLLCTAMNMIHGLTNYMSPADDDPETRMNKSELRSDFARQRRAIHFENRTEFCQRAIGAGWVPLSKRGEPSTQDEPNMIRTPALGPLSMSSLANGGHVSQHRTDSPTASNAASQIVESATSKRRYKDVVADRLDRTSVAVLSRNSPKPAILGQPLCQASFEYRFGTEDNATSGSSETITLEGAAKSDHLIRVIKRNQTFYEHDLLRHIALNVPRGGIYIDVGAYIGNHSVFFAKFLADFLVAIEPTSQISRIWERNVRGNGILDYALFEVALGAVPGIGRLVFPETDENLGMIRIEPAENVVELEDRASIVPVDTLDRVLGALPSDIASLPVSFIKIDVEGAELDVLKGAGELLRTHRPRISAELHNSSAYSAVDAFLRGFGYVERGRFGISPTYFFSHVSQENSAS